MHGVFLGGSKQLRKPPTFSCKAVPKIRQAQGPNPKNLPDPGAPSFFFFHHCHPLLGGSGVVISRVLSPLIWVISIVTLLITLLITTPEPPSRVSSDVD